MAVRGQDIASVIKRQIEEFGKDISMVDVGVVVEVGDGIARVHGLSGVAYNELLEFEGGIMGEIDEVAGLGEHTGKMMGCRGA